MCEIKEKLYRACLEYIDERIQIAGQAILSAREAAGNETKSSAGDKYETAREMMQQEIQLNERQLFEAKKLRHALSLINPAVRTVSAGTGSLVFTDRGNFFIAAGLGLLYSDGIQFNVISAASPVAKALAGHKSGDTVTFNQIEFTISEVF